MFGKSNKGRSAKIDTLIGQNTEVKGDVVFRGGLHVDGTIRGNIYAEPDSGSVMSVSERGLVEGEIRVPNVVLNGSVVGDVYATEHIELATQARVTGNVYYRLIEMARGSEVNGNLVHVGEGETFGATGGVVKAPKKPASAEKALATPALAADS